MLIAGVEKVDEGDHHTLASGNCLVTGLRCILYRGFFGEHLSRPHENMCTSRLMFLSLKHQEDVDIYHNTWAGNIGIFIMLQLGCSSSI